MIAFMALKLKIPRIIISQHPPAQLGLRCSSLLVDYNIILQKGEEVKDDQYGP